MSHSSCTAANTCAANTAAYLVKTVAPLLVSGENLYKTVGNGACFDCHGDKGVGGTEVAICSYAQGDVCLSTDVKTFDLIVSDVKSMALNGRKGGANTKICTDTVPAGANCAQNVSLYLKALGWQRKRQ